MTTTAPTTDHPLSLEQMREADQKRRERYNSATVTELPQWYAEKLQAARDTANAAAPAEPSTAADIIEAHGRRFQQPRSASHVRLDYDTAARLFHAYLVARLEVEGKALEVMPHEKPIIQNLIHWAIQSDRCEYDLRKGIYLFGSTGTCKSLFMSAMQYVTEAARQPTAFRIAKTALIADTIKAAAYAEETKARRLTADLQSLRHGAWCFDDLGEDNEPISVKLWGDDTPVMSPILSHRYDLYTALGTITHCTTNIKLTSPNPEEVTMETRYGSRIKDRMKLMFNFILLDGPSRRA